MPARKPDSLETLSEREKQTLRLLREGHDAKSIARALDLSVHTINERLRDSRRKLGVSSSREAARLLGEAERMHPNLLGDSDLGVAESATDGGKKRQDAGRSVVWIAGGILVMLIVIAATMLWPALPANTSLDASRPERQPVAADATAAQSAAAAAARRWATVVDGGRWEESWRAASAMFRSQVTAAQWADSVAPVRQPLGAVSSRVVQSVTRTNSLPGAPTGEYEVVQFETAFAQRTAIETVVMAREGDAWKVFGYFIR